MACRREVIIGGKEAGKVMVIELTPSAGEVMADDGN